MAGGKKDPINELSQKMLAGWILMAESCPLGCNVPLVENKKQNKIICVSCDRHFARDAAVGNELKPLPADTPLAVTSFSSNESTGGNNNSNNSNNSSNNSNYNSNSTNATSANSNSNSTTSAKKPNIDDYVMKEDRDYELDEYELGEGGEDDYVPPSDEELARHEERRLRNEKASVEIGVKLLAGWTMMDLHCPNPSCRTVLMKDKQNRKWCLACGTMVVSQDEFDSAKHVNVANPPSPVRVPPPILRLASDTEIVKPKSEKPVVPTPKLQPLQSPHVRSLNSAGQAIVQSNTTSHIAHTTPVLAAPHHAPSPPPVFAPPLTYATQVQIIDNSLQILYQKLNEYTRILSITTDLELSQGLCALIRECCLAISALNSVNKSK